MARARKLYEQKPGAAGAEITWTHYSAPGEGWQEPYERTGTVWSLAPVGSGLASAWWVVPEKPEPGEGHVVAVGKSSKAYPLSGWSAGGPVPGKGEVYGSHWWALQAGSQTEFAAKVWPRPEPATAAVALAA